MKTNENQKSTNHQPAAQKPFFGATPDHAFFSAERAASPPFFQPKTISPSTIQAKSATTEAEGITQPLVQRMPAFESEITANGEDTEPEIQSQSDWHAKFVAHTIQRRDQSIRDNGIAQLRPELFGLPVQRQQSEEKAPEENQNDENLQLKSHASQSGEDNLQLKSDTSQPEEAKEDNLQLKSVIENPTDEELPKIQNKFIQTKLKVGAPGDKYEQEADSMAAKVMAMSDSAIQRQTHEQNQELDETQQQVQMQPLANSITPLVQRQTEDDDSEAIQMKGNGASQASSNVENSLNSSKGGGSRLPEDVRSFMEPRFGSDFSNVRVHNDSTAVQMNKELGAQAFAHGNDIYYGAGKSPGNDDLMAHELTHTIQQTGGMGLKTISRKNDETEENPIQAKIDSGNAVIQRKEKPQVVPSKTNKTNSPTKITNTPPGQGKTNATPKSKVAIAENSSQSSATNKASLPKGGGNSPKGGKAFASAENDPGFKAVVDQTKNIAEQQKNHPPAQVKSAEAQAAALPPTNEVESKAQDRQVQEMNQQQPGEFNAAAFKAALMEKIGAVTPNTLEEADKFKGQNKLGSIKQDLSSQIKDEKTQAAQPIEEKAKETPDTSGITPKSVTPLPPKAPSLPNGNINAAQAAPKPKAESEVSLQQGSQSLNKQMTDAKVTEEQLANSNEPQFQSSLDSKKQAQTQASTAPNAYRQQEGGILAQAQVQAQTTAQTQLQGIHGQRDNILTQVLGQQGQTKGQDEKKRSEVANHIQGIYNSTKQRVENSLNQLDGTVNQQFDQSTATAQTQFENYVSGRMERYKQERYDGALGLAKWLKDKIMGMPSEVNTFYQEGKQRYLASMERSIDQISAFVAKSLQTAKTEIAKGKQEIQKYVASLDPSLRQVGQEAAQNIQGKFDELEGSINNKQDELINTLAQKYNQNLQTLNSRIDEMKAENGGLLDAAMNAMGETIKTIIELKNMLMGVLAKAAGALEKIIKDPIGFLGNLVTAVKQGFMNFMGNIWTHLKQGLMGWLTGVVGGAGIDLPESLDAKGIFTLAMQMLGLTYANIRGKASQRLGDKTVKSLEGSFDIFVILKNEGIGGLWRFIQDKIGDLKSMVLDGIQNFVVESVIKAGVTWILSLLNPASAFIRACKAIVDIIMFFIERGSQIGGLVSAILDSIMQIADGGVGGAATAVENALSKSLPVVISFMASLLGLGGIAGKVQSIIGKVRQPIDKGVDWVLGKAEKYANKFHNSKFGKKLESGKQWVEEKKQAGQKWFDDKKAAVERGIEDRKNKFANSKFGKKLTAANDWGHKQLDKLEQKRQAFNNKVQAIKESPQKQFNKLRDRAEIWGDKAKEKLFSNKSNKLKGEEGNLKNNKEDKDRKNQEKLDKAVQELQPKVHTLLGRGVSGIRLRVQLALWRTQHGLSRLDVHKIGKESFQIIAQVNPKAEIVKGVEIDREELLLYIRQVIQEVLAHPSTQKGAKEILDSKTLPENGKTAHEYTISKDNSISAVLAAAQKMDKRNRGTVEILNFDGNDDESKTQTRREQGWGDIENKIVYKMVDGKFIREDRKKADYISLAKELDNLGKTPNERRQIAGAIETWMRLRRVPEGFEQHKDLIAQIGTLLGVQESHRSKGGLAMAAFTMRLVRQNSWEDILTEKAGVPIYPMAPRDSQRYAKNLDNYLENWQQQKQQANQAMNVDKPQKEKEIKEAKKMMDREFNFIKAWLDTLDLKFADKLSEQDKVGEIKRVIRKRILAFSGINE
jgi:hypothetical protein